MLNNEAFEAIQTFHDVPTAAEDQAMAKKVAARAFKAKTRPKTEIEAITICDKALTGMPWGQKQLVLDFLYGKHVSPPQPIVTPDLDSEARGG